MGRLGRWLGRLGATLPARVLIKFGDDRGSHHAIVIAWNLLFSLFPIALVTAGVLGLVLRDVSPVEIYSRVVSIYPDPQSQAAALHALEGFRQQTGVFLLVGLAGLVWTGSLLFGAMDETFAFIYQVNPREFLQQRVMSLGMMLVFTVLTAIAIGTSALVTLLPDLPGLPRIAHGAIPNLAGQAVLGLVTSVLLFEIIYTVVPNLPLQPLRALPGALLAGVAFEGLALLFPLFVKLNRGLDQYGQSFAFLFVLLTFFYFVGVITVIGVELNAVLRSVPVKGGWTRQRPSKQSGQAPTEDARPARWTGVGVSSLPAQRRRPRASRPSRP